MPHVHFHFYDTSAGASRAWLTRKGASAVRPNLKGRTKAAPEVGSTQRSSSRSLSPTEGTGKERTAAGGAQLPAHIASLKIPPAWTEVRYSPDPGAALLVVGKDVKGREQRLYSVGHGAAQAEAKFRRIEELNRNFTAIERENDKQRATSKDPKVREAADVAALIMATGIRPGGEADTGADKKAYGATTLEGQHVALVDGKVRLRFVGKKGVNLDIPVNDAALGKMLMQRASKAGKDGKLFPATNDNALLQYVHSLDGGGFKTKDFRTLCGTRIAMKEVATIRPPTSPTAYKKAVKAVAQKVATALGNTPTVALASYISPVVFAKWRMISGAT